MFLHSATLVFCSIALRHCFAQLDVHTPQSLEDLQLPQQKWQAEDADEQRNLNFHAQAVGNPTETGVLFGLAIAAVVLLLIAAFGVGVYVGMVIKKGNFQTTQLMSQRSGAALVDASRVAPLLAHAGAHAAAVTAANAQLMQAAQRPPVAPMASSGQNLPMPQHRQTSAAVATLQQYSGASTQNPILASMRLAPTPKRSLKQTE